MEQKTKIELGSISIVADPPSPHATIGVTEEDREYNRRRNVLKRFINNLLNKNWEEGRVGKLPQSSADSMGRGLLVNLTTIGWDRSIGDPKTLRNIIDALIELSIDDKDLIDKMEFLNVSK